MTGTVPGIDYYEGNGSPSLDGLAFALHKATEGLHATDSAYASEIARIRTKVPIPGSYHFAWPTEDAKQQVGHYLTVAQPKAGELLALDLEPYPDRRNFGSMSWGQIDAWQQTFLSELHDATGGRNRVGLYVDVNTWSWLPSGTHGDFLWIAEYGVTAPHAHGWNLWQQSANGIDKDVALFDSAEAMKAWATFQEEYDMTPEQAQQLADIHAALENIGGKVWSYSHIGRAGDPDAPDVHQELHDGVNAAKAAQAQGAANGSSLTEVKTQLATLQTAVAALQAEQAKDVA